MQAKSDNIFPGKRDAKRPNTERWTSDAYRVRFAQIESIQPDSEDEEIAFDLSAWGISSGLRHLLVDYSDNELRDSSQWLTAQQNHLVADLLAQLLSESRLISDDVPQIEHLFITVHAELFLSHGLRMHVACVTNIVPREANSNRLEKFVAILDPGEVQAYVSERKQTNAMHVDNGLLH